MDHIQQSIDTLLERIGQQEAELIKTKSAVNALRAVLQLPPLFTDLDAERPTRLGNLNGDEFYGQPLSTVVRAVLEARKAAGAGAATVNELFTAMQSGGFAFGTQDEDNAKRGLRISLAKNSQTFHKLPNGKYGLRSWYTNLKDPKAKSAQVTGPDGEQDGGDFEDQEAKEKAAS